MLKRIFTNNSFKSLSSIFLADARKKTKQVFTPYVLSEQHLLKPI